MKKKDCEILVIDDSETTIVLLQNLLKENGYKVISATNGYSAIKLITKSNPDLIILDILMPCMDGFEVLANINKIRPLPVIMLSAMNDNTYKQKAINMGAIGYLNKPLVIEELLSLLPN